MRDVLREVLVGEQAGGGAAMLEPLIEEEEEVENQWRSFSAAGWMVPLQVPEPEEGRSAGPGFWYGGQDAGEAGWELPTSKKAWGKALAVEPSALEMDEELARRLQQEEIVAD